MYFFSSSTYYSARIIPKEVLINSTKIENKNSYKFTKAGIYSIKILSCDISTDLSEIFLYNRELISIKFGKKFYNKNITSTARMFSGCSSLISLDLSNLNPTNVENMLGMFRDCSSLTSLDLSNLNTQNVIYFE